MKEPIVIIGAGLSGLYAASLLASKGMECRVLEARGRIGGRALTKEVLDRPGLGKFDLGPTWFWPQYEPVISHLVKELDLRTFEQHNEGAILFEQSQTTSAERHMLPEGALQKSVRLVGGVASLVDAIAGTLPRDTIELNTRVTGILMDEDEKLTITAELADGKKKRIRAGAIILAIPPRIVAKHITFSPSLPANLIANLANTPTWMAGQAKAIAIYKRPFWREDGLSGQVMSWAGPMQEIHDASPGDTDYGALFGFFGIPAKVRRELGQDVRKLVINQLTNLFGSPAEKPISLLYKDWANDSETAVDADSQPLTEFPNYGPLISPSPWEKKVIFAGTETSSEFGGHLEGALRSAERAVLEVL